ncbi:MAG TPA: alpha/beta hydrolase-fold protein, partial [Acidimicrobiales bacterium]|nr:alpha/beta hydrolase-fold protein [Acidimicrobiales bacterium]
PSTWQAAKTTIPFILVAPLGQTLPGGYGPGPALDRYWVDWNPRYAAGGDQVRYSTPPPRFEHYVTVELPKFVKGFLPVEDGRGGQAIAGVSLGGYGAFKLGLQHPDLYSAMLSVSGAHNFLFAPAPGAVGPAISAPANSPIPIAYTKLPAPSGPVTSAPLPAQVGTFVTALDAFGDPAADQAYFRGNMPTDLAANGKGLAIDSFVNDMVPRRSQDTGSEPFELIVFPMNMDMQADFAAAGVPNTFAIHQGNHSDLYRNAWFRGLEEFAYAATQAKHPDSAPPDFSYRTIRTQFSIWGWRFDAGRSRPDTEFLNLSNVSCDHLTMSGSGTWTVTPPRQCRSKPVVVDLGSPSTVDQPATVVGQTRTITFTK